MSLPNPKNSMVGMKRGFPFPFSLSLLRSIAYSTSNTKNSLENLIFTTSHPIFFENRCVSASCRWHI